MVFHALTFTRSRGSCWNISQGIWQMSGNMKFPTMWYVQPAKALTSLRVYTVWSESLLVAWIFCNCIATDWTAFGISTLKRRLHRLVWVYSCQNATLLEISCRGSNVNASKNNVWSLSLHKLNLNSPKFMKSMALYFVTLSQSTGGWTFSLIFMFQGQEAEL